MILYHGSDRIISEPDLRHSRQNVDFGSGFYTTTIYEQAARWCGKFKRRGKESIINVYRFDEAAVNMRILQFDSYFTAEEIRTCSGSLFPKDEYTDRTGTGFFLSFGCLYIDA